MLLSANIRIPAKDGGPWGFDEKLGEANGKTINGVSPPVGKRHQEGDVFEDASPARSLAAKIGPRGSRSACVNHGGPSLSNTGTFLFVHSLVLSVIKDIFLLLRVARYWRGSWDAKKKTPSPPRVSGRHGSSLRHASICHWCRNAGSRAGAGIRRRRDRLRLREPAQARSPRVGVEG